MFIYKITNKINGKVYIGQTIVSINQRWSRHKSDSSKNSPYAIHRAIKKYGFDNFIVEEIDGANNISELNYREYLHIGLHNSMYPMGYNLKPGGNSRGHSEQTKKKIGYKTKQRMTIEMKQKISKALIGKKYTEDRLNKHNEMVIKTLGKPIKLENINTKEVIHLASISMVSKYGINVKIAREILNKNPNYRHRPLNGYWICYTSEDFVREESPKRRKKQPTTPEQMMARNQ
jgi:group I intron endonuclease